MVPVAFGTQTGGSIIRPASYCGVVGYKPSRDTINPTGVKPLANSFDTVGLLARSVDDCALVVSVLAGEASASNPPRPLAAAPPARGGPGRAPAGADGPPAAIRAVGSAGLHRCRAGCGSGD